MPLGSGTNTAVIYDQAGVRRLFEVPSLTKVEWRRSLDDISDAHATAMPPATGDDRAQCCLLLGRIFPWVHTLVVFRDGQRVWEGPVTKVSQAEDTVTIDALDVLGWLRRRPVEERITTEPGSVLVEADLVLTRGYAEHDPNVLAHRQVFPFGPATQIVREVAADSAYYADDLADLVDSGLRFTVLGRAVLLWNHSWILGQLPVLHPARDLVDTVTFARDGMTLATRVVARNDDGESAQFPVADADGVDIDYGLLAQVDSIGSVVGAAALLDIATAARQTAYPLPLVMVMPDGATLTCDADYDITQLVPGVMIPVHEDGLCWAVHQQMVLSEVHVTDTGGETVAITLVPLSEAQAIEGNTVSQDVTLSITDTGGRTWTLVSDDGSTAVFQSNA